MAIRDVSVVLAHGPWPMAHGPWADGSSWARVITTLKADGVKVAATTGSSPVVTRGGVAV
jgi:hypothetical protein